MNIHQKIEQFITHHALITHNQKIVIGLSGGPDSVFLLHTLIQLQKKYNLTLIAAHLNHEWRDEADQEEQMCHAIAQKLNVLCVSARLSSLQQHNKKYNGSKEEFARTMRRQFLEKVLREHNADRIALGHHAQDQQETFFIRLIRGTSLAGLTAMDPQHGIYIRPLLETNKSDIVDWLTSHTITYATDATNASPDYLRNRIRSTVLPALVHSDERWDNNFLTTLNRLKETELFLERLTKKTFDEISSLEHDQRIVDVMQFLNTDQALQHRIIIHWLIAAQVPFPPTQAFLDEIIRFVSNPHGGTHTIHEQWSLVKKQNKAFIKKN